MTNKLTRREFVLTAAATITGLAIGAFRAEQPAPVEDVQAVPLGDLTPDGTPAIIVDWATEPDRGQWCFFYNGAIVLRGDFTYELGDVPITLTLEDA